MAGRPVDLLEAVVVLVPVQTNTDFPPLLGVITLISTLMRVITVLRVISIGFAMVPHCGLLVNILLLIRLILSKSTMATPTKHPVNQRVSLLVSVA